MGLLASGWVGWWRPLGSINTTPSKNLINIKFIKCLKSLLQNQLAKIQNYFLLISNLIDGAVFDKTIHPGISRPSGSYSVAQERTKKSASTSIKFFLRPL